ncbi:hypothetical protein NPIL_274121 [Nephila pilipes]|uniref:Uncharacterized protein n=1 Tax=Nephila pilipes TaxID=299642 RepID=A0A8X6NRP9_NEPPI|nr:hypothetical protein NPIL_274121 [Nephila pilipes]
MPPCKSVCHLILRRPRISRKALEGLGKRVRPRKKYGQVSIITECFKTRLSVQETLAGPNKVAWENGMKKEHDTLFQENARTLVPILSIKRL